MSGTTTGDRSARPVPYRPPTDVADHREERLTEVDEVALARFTSEASRLFGTPLDIAATLRHVASLAVPQIADWCTIELLGQDGVLTDVATAHEDPAQLELIRTIRSRYPARPGSSTGSYAVVQSNAPVLVPQVTDEALLRVAQDADHAALLGRIHLRSYLALPLRSGDRVLGVVTLANDRSGRTFGPDDVVAVEALAARAGLAIDNAQAFQAADRFRRILDAVAEAVFLLEPETGRIVDANQTAGVLLGYAPNALPGLVFWDLVASAAGRDRDGRAPVTLAAPVLDGTSPSRTVSLRLRHADGTLLPVEVLLQRLTLPGEPVGLVAIARDTRERVDAQVRLHRLAEAEHARAAELHAVIRAIGDGVVVCDPDGRIRLANPAARELFAPVVPATYAEIVAQLHDHDRQAPALGRRGGPITLPTRSDRERWIEVATYPVAIGSPEASSDGPSGAAGAASSPRGTPAASDPSPPSAATETIVVLRDVTEARQREAVRETFIGVLSHELRTPITTIYGGSKLLSRPDSGLDPDTRRAVFLDIADEAERLQRLVEDVVALNRFGEEGGDLGQEPVLLQRVVPSVVRSEEGRWPAVRFTVAVPPGLPTVVADPTYVEQAVRNLLANAAKYSGPDASVDVVLEWAEDEVQVRILDDGPGIEPDEADRLFELFYRSPRTSGQTSGAGIGLFVCARLVRAMGGRVWARPRPAGGSEFGFSLRIMPDD